MTTRSPKLATRDMPFQVHPHQAPKVQARAATLRASFLTTGRFQDLQESLRLQSIILEPLEVDYDVDADLTSDEGRWVYWQPWLESQGYMLRPRYRRGWQSRPLPVDGNNWAPEDRVLIDVCFLSTSSRDG